MIPFDDIDRRLALLGKDRAWLAEKAQRSAGAVRSALAPNASPKHRSLMLQRALSDAIEEEEVRRMEAVILPERISIEGTRDEFTAWCRAALGEGKIVADWAVDQVNRSAAEWAARQRPQADEHSSASVASFSVPLLRAAAGVPILADAEPVEVERDLGPGRFLLELRGDSMEPRFRDKQRVILRDKATLKRPVLRYGDFYCFVHNGAATFKEWAKDAEGRKVLRSLNPEHADIPADEDTDWIGWFDPKDNR